MNSHTLPASPQKTRTQQAQAVHGSGPIRVNQQDYEQLSGDMPLGSLERYACCGGVRESILVDTKSPELLAVFEDMLTRWLENDTPTQPLDRAEQEVLPAAAVSTAVQQEKHQPEFDLAHPVDFINLIVSYVRDVFQMGVPVQSLEEARMRGPKVDALVQAEVKQFSPHNVIPLEYLVKKGLGVCRHQALLVGYLLAQFHHRFFPESKAKVYRFRTNLIEQPSSSLFSPQVAAHAVIIYQSENGRLYLIDSLRQASYNKNQGFIIDISKLTAQGRSLLRRKYHPYSETLLVRQILGRYKGNLAAEAPLFQEAASSAAPLVHPESASARLPGQ